jgi:acyl-CoA thioesterase-1
MAWAGFLLTEILYSRYIMSNYTKQQWLNGPDGQTPLDADRLNHMESGIEANSIPEVLVLEVGESVPVGTPAGTLIVQKSGVADPFRLAPAEDIPTITFSAYDVWSDTTTIAGSGRLREKRQGAAETLAGDGQGSTADLDLTGSSHYRYHGFPSAPDYGPNSTRSVNTTLKPGGSSQFANWLFGLEFKTASPHVRIALNPVATNGDLGFITVNGLRISTRAIIFTASAGNPTEAVLTFTSAKPRTIKIEGLNQNQGRFGGVTVDPGYGVTKPTTPITRRIAFLGDSFVNGNGIGETSASETETFAWRLATLMGGDEVIQAGVGGTGFVNGGGDGSDGLFINRVSAILAMNPDVLVIAGGYNDTATGLAAAIDAVMSASASIPERYLVYLGVATDVGDIYRSAATHAGVPFIGPDVASLPKLVDGVHPTYLGHQTLADEIYSLITES